jgi:polyphosphate kinase
MALKKTKSSRPRKKSIDLSHPDLYINRELSWLEFNRRVLEEALDERNPLLERLKFLAIFAGNLDEFFMVRVAGLERQVKAGALFPPPDGLGPAEQLQNIRAKLLSILDEAAALWRNQLLPQLYKTGIRVHSHADLGGKQRKLLRRYFEDEIFPTLTPLAIDPGHPFPHISNLSLNLAVLSNDHRQGRRFARLKVPDSFPRLLPLPREEEITGKGPRYNPERSTATSFVWLEEVIAANLDLLFPGLTIEAVHPFRITRDADLDLQEDEADDLLVCIQESVGQRRFGSTVRLEINDSLPELFRNILTNNLDLQPEQIYPTTEPLGMADLMQLTRINRPDLKDSPFQPAVPEILKQKSIFAAIKKEDILLYHPYDSFEPVVSFITAAARDPKVLAIKQTLYRVGPDSPIVAALLEARQHGKQVAVMLELKARFDETNNIAWAQALERAGVHVVYGIPNLKIHAKVCLIVRRERREIVRYVHLGTGNYNPATSRIYADLSYFTRDPKIGADLSHLFNTITGYSSQVKYQRLLVAPTGLRSELLTRIKREVRHHRGKGHGYLAFKLNSLTDPECIKTLYQASRAGVKIDLQVRGICCLRPGIPGVSENITVTSIVGRFLEHARIYYFENGGRPELLIGSADLMPRNLDHRIEVLFPVKPAALRATVRDNILQLHLADNIKNRRLKSDGNYERLPLPDEAKQLDSQQWLVEHSPSKNP